MLVAFDSHNPGKSNKLVYINPNFVTDICDGSDVETTVISLASAFDGNNNYYIVKGKCKEVANLLNVEMDKLKYYYG
jgi:hypothetical protein